MKKINKSIRKLQKTKNVSVYIDNNKNKTYLTGELKDVGMIHLPISKAVAEVLIASGFDYQG